MYQSGSRYRSRGPLQSTWPVGGVVYDHLTKINILWIEMTGKPAEVKRVKFMPFPKASMIILKVILKAAGIKSAHKG